jgi:hypothetical protein
MSAEAKLTLAIMSGTVPQESDHDQRKQQCGKHFFPLFSVTKSVATRSAAEPVAPLGDDRGAGEWRPSRSEGIAITGVA